MFEGAGGELALGARPLVTFALFSFNQERYIREAVEGALAQDYWPLEIIISDDCSTDKTVEVIDSIICDYSGPHRVIFNVNNINLGLVAHVNKIFEMASGELIVAAAGDDVSLPQRTSLLVEMFRKSTPTPMLIHSAVTKIDENGNVLGVGRPKLDLNEMSVSEAAISLSLYIGATGAWSKFLYFKYGHIVYLNAYEDLVFGFRALLCNSVAFVDDSLVMYRVGGGLSTKKHCFEKGFLAAYLSRRRHISVNIDVYSQRLHDVCVVENCGNLDYLKSSLTKRISLQKNKLLFYENKFKLFSNICSEGGWLALVAVLHEALFFLLVAKEFILHLVVSKFK